MKSLLSTDLPSCSTDIYKGLQSDLSIIGNLAATRVVYLLVLPFGIIFFSVAFWTPSVIHVFEILRFFRQNRMDTKNWQCHHFEEGKGDLIVDISFKSNRFVVKGRFEKRPTLVKWYLQGVQVLSFPPNPISICHTTDRRRYKG